MKPNGHASPVRFGDLAPPPPEFTIELLESKLTESTPGRLYQNEELIAVGAVNQLLTRIDADTSPGDTWRLRLANGKQLTMLVRTKAQALAGVPAVIRRH